MPVNDIVFSWQNVGDIIFLQCDGSYMVLSESDIVFSQKPYPPDYQLVAPSGGNYKRRDIIGATMPLMFQI